MDTYTATLQQRELHLNSDARTTTTNTAADWAAAIGRVALAVLELQVHALAGGEKFVGQGVVVGQEPARVLAERHHAGAGIVPSIQLIVSRLVPQYVLATARITSWRSQ